MATYKVPQDVEAEDKLLGPLSFRQFIYMMIAMGSAAVGFFLFQVGPVLVIIPLPFIILFGALSLPLRKDQPMETYLIAILRFYLKPKTRLWNPDGTITYVEITAPKIAEPHLAKEYGGETAKERLDYLARVMDTRGWALKGLEESTANPPATTLRTDVAIEAQSTVDIMDENADISKSFDSLIAKNDEQRRQDVMAQMRQASVPAPAPRARGRVAAPAAPNEPVTAIPLGPPPSDDNISLTYNPYPTSMHQKVVQPIGAGGKSSRRSKQSTHQPQLVTAPAELPAQPAVSAMPSTVSPAIIRLASNDDLSISALANEAHRLEAKDDQEVVIKLH